jgi:hypothetical protein
VSLSPRTRLYKRLLLEDMSPGRRGCQERILSVELCYLLRGEEISGGRFTAQVGIPLMESAEVVERMERPKTRKRGMKLKLGPRILNIGKGIE